MPCNTACFTTTPCQNPTCLTLLACHSLWVLLLLLPAAGNLPPPLCTPCHPPFPPALPVPCWVLGSSILDRTHCLHLGTACLPHPRPCLFACLPATTPPAYPSPHLPFTCLHCTHTLPFMPYSPHGPLPREEDLGMMPACLPAHTACLGSVGPYHPMPACHTLPPPACLACRPTHHHTHTLHLPAHAPPAWPVRTRLTTLPIYLCLTPLPALPAT